MAERAGLTSNLIIVTATVSGGVSLTLFTVFLFAGSLDMVHLGLSESAAFAWDGLLSLLFLGSTAVCFVSASDPTSPESSPPLLWSPFRHRIRHDAGIAGSALAILNRFVV